MSWTTSYPIPIRRNPTGIQMTWPVSLKIDNEYWTLCKTVYTDPFDVVSELFIFQTETCTMGRIEIIDTTVRLTGNFQFIEKNDHQLYLWKENNNKDGMILCNLDMKSRIISLVLTIFGKELYEYTPIIGDRMYALFHDVEEQKLTLKTINLSTRKVIRDTLLKSTENYEYGLLINNGKLYVLEFDEKIGIRIYEFKNELMLLSEQTLDERAEEIDEIYATKDGVTYGVKKNRKITYYCYEYDFENLKWEKEICRLASEEYKKCHPKEPEEFDGITYAVVPRPLSNLFQLEVRGYEYEPKLSTICYLNIVKELMKTEDLVELERIKQLLPIQLRQHLSNMMKWRLEEKEYRKKLKEDEREEVLNELSEMMGDGTIDGELFDAIVQIFASDNNGGNENDDGSDEEDEQIEEEEEQDMD